MSKGWSSPGDAAGGKGRLYLQLGQLRVPPGDFLLRLWYSWSVVNNQKTVRTPHVVSISE